MKINKLWKWIFLSILWLLIGLLIGINYQSPNPINSLESEKEYVDSIQTVIDTLLIEKDVVKWKIDKVIEEKEVAVDSIKNLPTTEAVEYLNNKLKEYESNN